MELTAVLLLPGILAAWVATCLVLSATGGWRNLAKAYPASDLSSFDTWHFQGCRLGWVGYNGCVTFGTNWQGIHVSLWWIFRPGHPPLEIPFADIKGKETRGWLLSFVDLEFAGTRKTRMRVLRKVADRFEQAAGGRWHYERSEK